MYAGGAGKEFPNGSALIRQALKRFSADQIERGLVAHFLLKNGISASNTLVAGILSIGGYSEVLDFLANANFPFDVYSLIGALELLVAPGRKGKEGAVYTPKFIVDYIVEKIIDRPGTVIDLSCGSGAFLIGALERLHNLTGLPLKDLARKYVFGLDLSEQSVRQAEIVLTLYLLASGENCDSHDFNLAVGNSIKMLPGSDDWLKSAFDVSVFDFVVGNPPYVKFQDLDDEVRKLLSSGWQTIKGYNYNLHFAFFEIGLRALADDGKLGYIVPNNIFTTKAAEKLRKFLSSRRNIRQIVNFNHLRVFPNASTYTCIVMLDNAWGKEFFNYSYVSGHDAIDNLEGIGQHKVMFSTLDSRKWRLLDEKDCDNIHKIESAGKSIGTRFGIHVGIATLKDEAYIVRDADGKYCTKDHQGRNYRIEREMTRRIVKIPLVSSEDDIEKSNLRIIFPYRVDENGRFALIEENDLAGMYPECYRYLIDRRGELVSRDGGKIKKKDWYAYGRTQGFNHSGPRLYTRTFSSSPNFLRDDGDALFCNGYAIFIDRDIDVFQKVLNSGIMNYYIRKTSAEIGGDYQCYQKSYIEKFSIPDFSTDEIEYIRSENDTEKLDYFLMRKYGLEI